jgi:hypothetical protein
MVATPQTERLVVELVINCDSVLGFYWSGTVIDKSGGATLDGTKAECEQHSSLSDKFRTITSHI